MSDAAIQYPRHALRWLLAAGAIILLHGALGAALLQTPPSPSDDEPAGAITIELAPLVTKPAAAIPDQPLGPTANAETASPATPPQQETSNDAPASKVPDVPPSPATKPEVAVPIKPPPETPKNDDGRETRKDVDNKAPTTVPNTKPAPPPRIAASAASATQSELTDSKPSASRPGKSSKPSRALLNWQKALLLTLDRQKRYPPAARQKKLEGITTVGFIIDRQGKLISSRIIKSSGAPLLDEESLSVLSRASPLPPPPDGIGDATVDLALPIQFRIQN